MNKKQKNLIIALLIIIAILLFVWILSPAQEEQPQPEQTQTEEQPQTTQSEEKAVDVREKYKQYDIPVIQTREVDEKDIQRMALSFAERFGSYSNQSSFGNITDLTNLMSQSMKAWADEYVANARKQDNYSGIYYGITTKAISGTVKVFNQQTGEAQVLVKTKRKESVESMNNSTVFYQDILISFVQEKGLWKIDSASWIKK